jgi:hypothetical protein
VRLQIILFQLVELIFTCLLKHLGPALEFVHNTESRKFQKNLYEKKHPTCVIENESMVIPSKQAECLETHLLQNPNHQTFPHLLALLCFL